MKEKKDIVSVELPIVAKIELLIEELEPVLAPQSSSSFMD